jgi:hypothetical protein
VTDTAGQDAVSAWISSIGPNVRLASLRRAERAPRHCVDVGHDERVLSWMTLWNSLYPEDRAFDPHDDRAAEEMHRLRGLVMAQAAETEAVLGQILGLLDPTANPERPAGALLKNVYEELQRRAIATHEAALAEVDAAIRQRNRAVHDAVVIGSTWMPYATGGGGHWEPVISLMNGKPYDESDLRRDLDMQRKATASAVRIYRDLTRDSRVLASTSPAPGRRQGRKEHHKQ